jgi:hypothetical protein
MVERELSELKAAFDCQQTEFETAHPRLKYQRSQFKSHEDKVFKVAVVGAVEDSERRLNLIECCDRFESAVKGIPFI